MTGIKKKDKTVSLVIKVLVIIIITTTLFISSFYFYDAFAFDIVRTEITNVLEREI